MVTKSFLKCSPKGKQASVTGMSASISQTLLARPTCLCSTWAYWKQWLTYWTRFPVARRIHDSSWKDWVESGEMVCFKDSKQSAFKQKHVVRLAECVCQYWQCLVVWKCKSKNNCGNFWLVKPKQGLSYILYCRASWYYFIVFCIFTFKWPPFPSLHIIYMKM